MWSSLQLACLGFWGHRLVPPSRRQALREHCRRGIPGSTDEGTWSSTWSSCRRIRNRSSTSRRAQDEPRSSAGQRRQSIAEDARDWCDSGLFSAFSLTVVCTNGRGSQSDSRWFKSRGWLRYSRGAGGIERRFDSPVRRSDRPGFAGMPMYRQPLAQLRPVRGGQVPSQSLAHARLPPLLMVLAAEEVKTSGAR